MFQESELDPYSTLEHRSWSNNQSHHDLLYGGVSLSISLNLKLPQFPTELRKGQLRPFILSHFDICSVVWGSGFRTERCAFLQTPIMTLTQACY